MLDSLRDAIRAATLADEPGAVARLQALAALSPEQRRRIAGRGAELVRAVRGRADPGVMEAFLAEYGLSTREGVALMCLAEALLRVPDAETIDDLIQDKIAPHDWGAHIGDSGSLMVNASTWALMLTGRVLAEEDDPGVVGLLRGMVRRLGEPVIRTAVGAAMRRMGAQFVLGRNIGEAMGRAEGMERRGYAYSYDMLGEAARTEADAARYQAAYAEAIAAIAGRASGEDLRENPGISVKLSALHPRYEAAKRETMLPALVERTLRLARAAAGARIGFNIDAEEADRLDLSLDVIEAVLSDPGLAGWDGFGVVVQAYGPRAAFVIDWLDALAEKLGRRIMVRLVKGAYWDSEIKRAQAMGLAGFPVFTRKAHTDVSYLGCARRLLEKRGRIYPQFATHNAHTVAAILEMAGAAKDGFEFQRLHGMGEALHEAVKAAEGTRCRIYAPVGAHRDLLAYLVRRLLENGANSSFVHQIVDESVPPEAVARDPFEAASGAPNPAVARPAEIFGPERRNSAGWDLTDPATMAAIEAGRAPFAAPHRWRLDPIAPLAAGEGPFREIRNPARPEEVVGFVREADAGIARAAVDRALEAQPGWAATPVAARAELLRRIADRYEAHAFEIFALLAREAGKTLADGVAELREAVDFLRYYANEAPRAEAGSAPRGAVVCISPWNFPLAIFTGQIAAALAAGNAVIAKPAEQTPLIAARAVALMREAGLPEGALQLLPGDGPGVGAPLTADPRIAGVCFTGSTEVAKIIDRQLAETAPEAMLIAETGGINAMIVDSTALPEQAVRDILASAFQSAGQRCSALRILYVQKDVEARLLEMLFGAMETLTLGDPWAIATDIGPVIDAEAREGILSYVAEQERQGRLLKRLDAPETGIFAPPSVIRVSGIEEMAREVFGPALHVAAFEAERIDAVVAAVNAKGYGLTFGLHTRIDARVQRVVDRARVGNLYVNRNQIGAVVGSQPFGGEGLSGTGPKAGGPHYLPRFRRRIEPAADPARGGSPETASPVRGAADEPLSAAALAAALAIPARGWAARGDRVAVLERALDGRAAEALRAAAALEAGPVDLPGPTGEANRLTLAPRGIALCLGPSAEAALEQAAQALAGGSRVLMVAPGAQAACAPLAAAGAPIAALDGRPDPAALTELAVDVVALVGGDPAIRRALAARDGPIPPLITERIAPAAYRHERALCVDVTAAGGNADLFVLAG